MELTNGATAAQVCKKIGVNEQTCYRWRAEYGGMRVDQAKQPEGQPADLRSAGRMAMSSR